MLRAAQRALGTVRLGAGPCRFVAYAAAQQSRPRRRTVTVEAARAAAFLAPLPAAMLRVRAELAALPDVFERLGLRTLGELAALPSRSVAERFGHPGLLALDLARGRDTPLQPRRPPEPVSERLDLPEAASGQQLERALDLLIARLLARRERRGRSLRALAVSARFVAGGTWRQVVTMRTPSADAQRIRLALGTRLAELPAPADSLAARGRVLRPPGPGAGAPGPRSRGGAARAPGGGRAPGPPVGRARGRAANPGGGPRLAAARAAQPAGALPRREAQAAPVSSEGSPSRGR